MAKSPDDLGRIQAIFDRVIQLPPQARQAFLNQEGLDDATREWIGELIQRFESDSTLIPEDDRLMIHKMLGETQDPEILGQNLGNYRVLEKLGEGGMGAVYLAERADGVFDKKVAIKLVRGDWRSAIRLDQFQQERQILARLQHPLIARLLDGGSAADGVAYLVMDYIEGESITAYCDRMRLTIDERIALVIKLCDAVQYAHQNLVVHRDLKPTNILVQDNGDPILIDFGIAKTLQRNQPSTEGKINQTLWFSPSYASPEQILGHPIATASDIYAMGILLHELLTGILPYDLPQTTVGKMRAFIRQHRPQKPSTLVKTSQAETSHSSQWLQIAARRQTKPNALLKSLRGDLDAILMRTMAVDPNQRYATIQQLADDLRHFQAGYPISVRPLSYFSRWWKWVKRNPLSTSLGMILLVAILGFTIYTQLQNRRILLERDRVTLAFSLLQEFSKVEAPDTASRDPITHLEMLEFKAKKRPDLPEDQFEVALEGHLAMAEIFLTNGMVEPAESEIQKATTICKTRIAPKDLRQGRCQFLIGALAYLKSHFHEAETHLREALKVFEIHKDYEKVANTQLKLAQTLRGQGNRAKAIPLLEAVLHTRQEVLGLEDASIATVQLELGQTYRVLSEFDCAEWLLHKARENRVKDSPHLTAFTAKVNLELGNCLNRSGRPREALPYLLEALSIGRRLYGHTHQLLGVALGTLGSAQRKLGNWQDAEQLYLEGLDIKRMILGEDHQSLAANFHNLGIVNQELGRPKIAAEYFAKAVQRNLVTDGPKINLAFHHFRLGALQVELGNWQDGEYQLCEAIELFLRHSSQPHRRIAQAQIYLAQCLEVHGETKAALPLVEKALPALRPGDGAEQAAAAQLLTTLACTGFADAELTPAFESLHRLRAKNQR